MLVLIHDREPFDLMDAGGERAPHGGWDVGSGARCRKPTDQELITEVRGRETLERAIRIAARKATIHELATMAKAADNELDAATLLRAAALLWAAEGP